MPDKKREVPESEGEKVNYEGHAEIEEPVDPAKMPSHRADRAPPSAAGPSGKGQGEIEQQAPPAKRESDRDAPRTYAPASNESVTRDSHAGD